MASLDEVERFLNIDTDDKILHKGKRKEEKNRYYKYRGQYYIVELTKDKWMIMDDSDLTRDLLEDHTFYCGINNYGMTNINKKSAYIHRLITDCDEGNIPDHVNRKSFDNRSTNLCEGTYKDNARNRSTQSNNTTGKTGVIRTRCKGYYYYTAYIRDNDGNDERKSFSIAKLGEAGAKRRAIRHRKNMEILYGYLGE